MTVDDVARRAGVGRATLYRRWPTKTAMVIDALGRGRFPTLEDPDTGDPRATSDDDRWDNYPYFGEPAKPAPSTRRPGR